MDFIDWQKLCPQQQPESAQNEKGMVGSIQNLTKDKTLALVLKTDTEIYNLIKDYYTQHQFKSFLDDSFDSLFTNILILLRKSHYNKALEILNLGTLLLLKQNRAELKRLLKFLYLTANSIHAPRICESKPNNSILLNHFAECVFNTKAISYEEMRLMLNFMLNNFDHLFKLDKGIEENVAKRRSLMEKYGKEEALMDKAYCKRVSNKEYEEFTKEETNKAIVGLINHMVDDPKISLKQKKLKLKLLQRVHPEVYEKHFADLLF